MAEAPWEALCLQATLGLALAALAAARLRLRARRRLGRVLVADGRGSVARALRLALVLGCWTWLAAAGGVPPAATALALAAALAALLCPAPDEERAGTDGVQVGWTACSFAELESWRLAGEHLRFRVAGRWLAVRVPEALQEELRGRLTRQAAAREARIGA